MLYFEAKPLKSTDHQGAATWNKTELGRSSLALLQSSRKNSTEDNGEFIRGSPRVKLPRSSWIVAHDNTGWQQS
jgi:hypothetical protein